VGARIHAVVALVALGGCLATPDPKPLPEDWLVVENGRIRTQDGALFRGRGAAIPDTRGCDACTFNAPVPSEVERRLDLLIDDWGANFVRLMMESYSDATAGGRINYGNAAADAAYLADLERLVDHVAAKPGAYVVLTLWSDPTLNADIWPTAATADLWALLATTFADQPRVLFQLSLGPQSPTDGSQDEALWAALDDTVAAIRAAEQAAGGPPHIILVPGLVGGTEVEYFIDHPITAGDGAQIAYAVNVDGPPSGFADAFVDAAADLPLVIAMFAPFNDAPIADSTALMVAAEAAEVPWLSWMFHMRCFPAMLVDNSGGSCGVDMTLEPTEWGTAVMERLSQPW
jgi:hypothetical protein